MSFNYAKVGKFFRRTVEETMDEAFGARGFKDFLVTYCRSNDVRTESQFVDACYTDTPLEDVIDYLMDTADNYMRTNAVLSINDAHTAIDDVGQFLKWDYIFSEYWIPKHIIDLAVIMLKYEFDNYGYDALVSELYNIIKADIN